MVDPTFPSFDRGSGRPIDTSFGVNNDVFRYIRSKIEKIPNHRKPKPWGLHKLTIRKVVEKALNYGLWNGDYIGLYTEVGGTPWDTGRWVPNFDYTHIRKRQIDRILGTDAVNKTGMSITALLSLRPYEYEHVMEWCEKQSRHELDANKDAVEQLSQQLKDLEENKNS